MVHPSVVWLLNCLTCLMFPWQQNLNWKERDAIIVREIEGGEETNKVALPVVVSCQKGMAEQRIPNMKGIMGAQEQTIESGRTGCS